MSKKFIISLLSLGFLLMGCNEEDTIVENEQPIVNYSITTIGVSNVGLFTAVLEGKVDMPLNDNNDYLLGFQLSTDQLFPTELTRICIVDSIESDSTYSFTITRSVGYNVDMPQLNPGTQYFLRSFIKLNDVCYVGAVKEFNTIPVEISTGIIDTISNTINCKVNLFLDGSWADGILGVCYSKTPAPTVNDYTVSNDKSDIVLSEDGSFSITIYPLYGGSLYYRAFYAYNGKTYYGETLSLSMPYKAVDMGLSVKWATCNVGASKPEEYGDYYAWGETETKSSFSWSTYKWCKGSYDTQTKYVANGSFGTVDDKIALDLEDDVAHVKWGGNWRIPSRGEQEELCRKCTWEWYDSGNSEFGGVAGYKITSKISGYTDRSIFLSANAQYWSGSLNAYDSQIASTLELGNYSGRYSCGYNNRYKGLSIRPVCTSESWWESATIELSDTSQTVIIDKSFKIKAVVNNNNDDVINAQFEWTSDNPSVAVVDLNGVVKGISKGTAHISVSIQSLSAQCTIAVIEESEFKHEFVDLGLSVKWATFNVGATKPEEYGDYYSWGETELKSDFSWSSYKWCNDSNSTLTKYNTNSSYGAVDNKTTLDPEDDVAYAKWGNSWRMPTAAEQRELIDNCTWKWYGHGNSEFGGVPGYMVTSNMSGYTDHAIFLPAVGGRGGFLYGSTGYYWSSSIWGEDRAEYLGFSSDYINMDGYARRFAFSVRPVCP